MSESEISKLDSTISQTNLDSLESLESKISRPKEHLDSAKKPCKTSSIKNHKPPKVIAIDSIYATICPKINYASITLERDLFHALKSYDFDLFFLSDVLHHLSIPFTRTLLDSIAHIPNIIIKDIDSTHKFGHFMNAAHDLIFNQERIVPIYPKHLSDFFSLHGFCVRYTYMPKLWYPHFVIIATKQNPQNSHKNPKTSCKIQNPAQKENLNVKQRQTSPKNN